MAPLIPVVIVLLAASALGTDGPELERVFRVSESLPPGAHIGFIRSGQPLDGAPQKQNYFIVFPPGTAENLLLANDRSGEIRLLPDKSLDHEREARLHVLAIPVDGTAPISVLIDVQDVNDNEPVFPNESIRLEVSEYARINTGLSLPLAQDEDSRPFNVQRYRIASGNMNNAFRLSHTSAVLLELVVNGRLDREYRHRYDLVVEAIDGGTPPKTGTLKVHIDVLDANDNHPEFVQPRYSARIGSRTAPGIPILRVGARDPDAGENGRVSYRIVSQSLIGPGPTPTLSGDGISPASAPFQLDAQSGTLSLQRPFPAKMPVHTLTYELLIAARDHGVPDALESSTTAEVVVEGATNGGDNHGALRLGVIWLTEDGTGGAVPEGLALGYVLARVSVETFEATARDTGREKNDRLGLLLLGGRSVVCLRQTDTPQIYLLVVCGHLNREKATSLQMDLLLRNGTSADADVLLDHPLHLAIQDVNDNAPRWNQTQFSFRWALEEEEEEHNGGSGGEEESNYLRLIATDADEGDNARIRYTVLGTQLFAIDPEMGVLSLAEDKLPDCPLGEQLHFQVQAEDHGSPEPLRSRVNVSVQFVQAAPASQRVNFSQSVYETNIREDIAAGSCILQLSALDKGICGGNSNSAPAMRYWLAEGPFADWFKLDEGSGMLCVGRREIDIERTGESVLLKAMAANADGEEASAQVVINVEDVNNHSPVFRPREYALLLSPDALNPTGTTALLLRVRAVDNDWRNATFGDISYALGEGLGAELFQLDPKKGELRLNELGAKKLGTMGEDDQQMYYGMELRVHATDGGGRASEEMGVIRVRLLPPHFHCMSFSERIYHFNVSEETLPGIGIGDLRVLDVADSDKVHFEIVHTDRDQVPLFAFDEGRRNRLVLEAELDADFAGGEAHLLNVKAFDSVNNCTNFTQVLVHVLGVNDNPPVFAKDKLSVQVPEDFAIHKTFIAVHARDKDRNEDGRIIYELAGTLPQSVPVQIHPDTGHLSLSAPLDAERPPNGGNNNSAMLVRVRARDHGIPTRQAQMEVLITVADVNDNAPVFELPEYSVEVAENRELMSTLLRVQARDADISPPNRRVRYAIRQTSPALVEGGEPVLGINARTGEIFTRQPLDREQFPIYAFELEAADGGSPPRRAITRLQLRLLDENDNAPNCSLAELAVRTGQRAGDRVGRVQASDPDEGSNGTVRFRMQQPNIMFELNAKGELFLRQPVTVASFDHNSAPLLHSFAVIAEDQSAELPLSSVCQVFVRHSPKETAQREGQQVPLDIEMNSGVGIRLEGPVRRELALDWSAVAEGQNLVRVNATGVHKWTLQKSALSHLFSVLEDGTLSLDRRMGDQELRTLANRTQRPSLTVQMESSDGHQKHLTLVLRQKANELSAKDLLVVSADVNQSGQQRPLVVVGMEEEKASFYRLEGTDDETETLIDNGLFELDEFNGALYLANVAAFAAAPANVSRELCLRISAHPRGESPAEEGEIKKSRLVKVQMTGWREQKPLPKCSRRYQRWAVSEAAPIGSLVGRLDVDDMGASLETNNTRNRYRFSALESSSDYFRVDDSEGSVFTRKALNGQMFSDHLLLVAVSDQQQGEHRAVPVPSAACVVRIVVEEDSSGPAGRGTLRFMSASNTTLFAGNLERGLYPGGVFHHFVARDEAFQRRKLDYRIVAGNEAGTFQLDGTSGALSIPDAALLNSSQISSVRLTVRASSFGGKVRVEQHFTVRVDYSTRQFVYFERRTYALEFITEGTSGGHRQFLTNLKRKDRPGQVQFSVLPELPGLKLDADEGTLEYQVPEGGTPPQQILQNLTLIVIARESNCVDHATLTLVPKRVGQGPKIEPSSCGNVSVPENLAVDILTRVRVLDSAADGTSPGVVFAIEGGQRRHLAVSSSRLTPFGGNWRSLFTIDPHTGWLSCRELDRESMAEHLLIVSASDVTGSPRKADVCTVRVRVLDQNDNAPKFEAPPEPISVAKTTPIGQHLATFSATDADQEDNGRVRYLLDNDPSELFHLEPDSGALIFERESPFMAEQTGVWISVKAVDVGSPTWRESQPVRVRVNWERRGSSKMRGGSSGMGVFGRRRFFASVPESRPKGQFVAQLATGTWENITYAIVGGDQDSAFQVDSAGRVSTALELDAEITRHYALQIAATDVVGLRAEAVLEVRVLDANDNAPFISRIANVKVPEALPVGSLVTTVSATDVDTNSVLEYSLAEPSAHFEISRWTGAIHLTRKLDFEIAKKHTLRIQVSDGTNRAHANMTLDVLDSNDNAPRFEHPSLIELEVSRDMPAGTVLARVSATDADGSAKNGGISYELVGEKAADLVELNANSGELRLRRATADWHNPGGEDHFLTVMATDSGRPALQSFCVVRLVPAGNASAKQNAQWPALSRSNYTFSMSENAHAHLAIGRLSLRSPAPAPPLNCDFRILPGQKGSDNFGVDFSGAVIPIRQLDRERGKREWMEFEVSVGQCPPRSPNSPKWQAQQHKSRANVRILLLDENDNAPLFGEDNVKQIWIGDEGIGKNGNMVAGLNASDADATPENARIHYKLLAGDPFGMFRLDADSGELRLLRWDEAFASLVETDQNNNGSSAVLELVVSAQDGGVPSRSAEWTLAVGLDWPRWSGSAPRFPLPVYRKFVPENAAEGVLFAVRANSRAGRGQERWRYRLEMEDGAMDRSLSIDPSTGNLVLRGSLDLEGERSTQNGSNPLFCTVTVEDAFGRNATVPVQIHIVGVDEFAPVFTKSAYTFKLPTSPAVGQPFGQVVAEDRDVGTGGTVHYLLDPSDRLSAQFVSLSSETGVLSVLRVPPRGGNASEPTVLRFTVLAESGHRGEDGGAPGRQRARATVYVEVGDSVADVSTAFAPPLPPFNWLIVLVLPALLFLFCILAALVLSRMLLRHHQNAVAKNGGGTADFLRPVPKKRMFSVSSCRELQQSAEEADFRQRSGMSQSFESGQFSCAKRTLSLARQQGDGETAVSPADLSTAPNYVNVAVPGAGSRRSQPDSGIDPDAQSLASENSCALADAYLRTLGVEGGMEEGNKKRRQRRRSAQEEATQMSLDGLIYAPIDEIVPRACSTFLPKRADLLGLDSTGWARNNNSIDPDAMESRTPFKPLSQLLAEINAQQRSMEETRGQDGSTV